jgi:ribonuclease HII
MEVGLDEAGRGPLFGRVYAAAVVLNEGFDVSRVKDSKKFTSEKKRKEAAEYIMANSVWSVCYMDETMIDKVNILQATMLAMRRAIESLSTTPSLALIDGNRCPVCQVRTEAIVKGDDKVAEISAASILAKTARDAALMVMHKIYPNYAFDQHKGYPTALHLERLREHGVSPVHRRSYGPVRELLNLANRSQ